jgi:hypothetical protein
MQEVLMSVSPVQQRSSQLPLFARPQCSLHWTDLPSSAQQKMVQLLVQLLRQHRGNRVPAAPAEEAHGE